MKKSFIFFGALLVGALSFSACGGSSTETTTTDSVVVEQPVVAEATQTEDLGAKIYKEKCQVCHQENGEGLAGAFPPLAKSDYLFADKVRAVRQVLKGSSGEITVNGQKYNSVMPPQVEKDEDAIAVVNYILNAWGNNGGTVTADDVKKAREME